MKANTRGLSKHYHQTCVHLITDNQF